MRRENASGTPLDYYGMTTRTMHDPVRLRARAVSLVEEAKRELRVAALLLERAEEIERGEYTRLRVPTIFDDDYPTRGLVRGQRYLVVERFERARVGRFIGCRGETRSLLFDRTRQRGGMFSVYPERLVVAVER